MQWFCMKTLQPFVPLFRTASNSPESWHRPTQLLSAEHSGAWMIWHSECQPAAEKIINLCRLHRRLIGRLHRSWCFVGGLLDWLLHLPGGSRHVNPGCSTHPYKIPRRSFIILSYHGSRTSTLLSLLRHLLSLAVGRLLLRLLSGCSQRLAQLLASRPRRGGVL